MSSIETQNYPDSGLSVPRNGSDAEGCREESEVTLPGLASAGPLVGPYLQNRRDRYVPPASI
jgi:hypothetical protein